MFSFWKKKKCAADKDDKNAICALLINCKGSGKDELDVGKKREKTYVDTIKKEFSADEAIDVLFLSEPKGNIPDWLSTHVKDYKHMVVNQETAILCHNDKFSNFIAYTGYCYATYVDKASIAVDMGRFTTMVATHTSSNAKCLFVCYNGPHRTGSPNEKASKAAALVEIVERIRQDLDIDIALIGGNWNVILDYTYRALSTHRNNLLDTYTVAAFDTKRRRNIDYFVTNAHYICAPKALEMVFPDDVEDWKSVFDHNFVKGVFQLKINDDGGKGKKDVRTAAASSGIIVTKCQKKSKTQTKPKVSDVGVQLEEQESGTLKKQQPKTQQTSKTSSVIPSYATVDRRKVSRI